MYNNIGKKISGWAKFVCIVGIVLSVLGGLLLAVGSGVIGITGGVLLGVLIAVIGSVASWVSSLVMYGFGELITKTDETNESLKQMAGK